MTRYFVRSFAEKDVSYKKGLANFRSAIGTFAYTPEGLVVQHILKGIELALETQTQLFVLFDHAKYLGCCLLGEQFSLHTATGWVEPEDADSLAITLATISSHESSLESLAAMLSELRLLDGSESMQVQTTDIDTPAKLARLLGMLNIASQSEETIKGLESEISHLSYKPTMYSIVLDKLTWLLEMLTIKKDDPYPADMPVYFPPGQLPKFSNRNFALFCAFGSRAPSFWASKGVEYVVPSMTDPDPLSAIPENGTMSMPVIVIGSKLPHVACDEWRKVASSKKIKFDANERSKESRAYVYKAAGRNDLWRVLRETVGTLTPRKKDSRGRDDDEDEDMSAPVAKKGKKSFSDLFG